MLMNMNFTLSGYKTYIVGVAMIIVGLYQQNAEMVMMGFGLMTTRAAIAKLEQ
jgi:hypothetical protein